MIQLPTNTILARRMFAALALAVLSVALFSGPALAEPETFTVKNTKSGGPGSLRSAIQKANDNGNPGDVDTIDFNIQGTLGSIVPTSPLPTITEAVTIDGFTQTGAGPNDLKIRINGANAGRRASGLKIEADDTTIRGLVINRFKKSGILVKGANNTIEGNYIGTDQTGIKDHANGRAGVLVMDGLNNKIGGLELDDPNLISWNRGGGVRVEGTPATGNSILSNRIYNNAGLGIDLNNDGVTPNDVDASGPNDDVDTGPNNLQNFPTITSATSSGGTTTVNGTLDSTPGQTFTIQCFLTGGDGASEHGEGRNLLDEETVTTDAGGNDTFTCESTEPEAGQTVSATATSSTGDTSEFSENELVQ